MELLNRLFYAVSLDNDLLEPGMDLRELHRSVEEARRSQAHMQEILRCTGLSRDLDRQVPKDLGGRAVLDHGPHALGHCVPGAVSDLDMGARLRHELLYELPVRIGLFI